MSEEQIEELRLRNNRTQAEIEKLMEESAKLRAEGLKYDREFMLYPIVVAAGLMGAGAALMAAAIKLF